ncbi:MAG: hypothetical protein MUO67_10025, partial [Anaerolineales bacterium]|nr:hypothetical protein [Anaerolineales bacterium]
VPLGFISFQIPVCPGCLNFGALARDGFMEPLRKYSGAPNEGGRSALPRLIGTLWATMSLLKYTEFWWKFPL